MKGFLRNFIIYIVIVGLIHFLLFIYLGGVGMADDISTEERKRLSSIPLFIINKLFGFPLSLIFKYDPINAERIGIWLILLFISNCLIQFSILSFLWKLIKSR